MNTSHAYAKSFNRFRKKKAFWKKRIEETNILFNKHRVSNDCAMNVVIIESPSLNCCIRLAIALGPELCLARCFTRNSPVKRG